MSSRQLGIAPSLTTRLSAIALPAALVYFLIIGGTYVGELSGAVRIVNSVLAGALILVYLIRVGARHDRIDRSVVLALVLFVLAGVASAFPRQSLDAVLGALAFAAAFYVAREATADPAGSRATITTLRVLSLLVTALVATQIAAVNLEWLRLSDGLRPPIGLRFDARPFGHQYDLVTLALMLFPSWLVGKPSAPRSVVAAVIGVVLAAIVVLAGSRAVWLAVALATLVIAVPVVIGIVRRETRVNPLILIGGGLVLLAAVLVLAGPIVDRLLTSSTLDQRLAMWGSATEVWLGRPVTGYGPGTFPWLLQMTDHFDGNSIHPRHPDSGLFQLLPEGGLLGIGAALVLLVGVGLPLLMRSRAAAWAVGIFIFGAIGGNPTDFPYLIAMALTWAAYGLPRPRALPVTAQRRPVVRWASIASFALVALAVASMLIGGLRYDAAVAHVHAGDVSSARRDLNAAVALDPGMAIYARQRGIADLLLSEPRAAIADLQRATATNPNDDLSWRALAMAQEAAGELGDARVSLDRAIALQRSDVTNLLLSAESSLRANDRESFEAMAAEIVLGWPGVITAPGWRGLDADGTAELDTVDAAIERWLDGEGAPVTISLQPLLLALMGHQSELLDEAAAASGLSSELVEAMRAVYWCEGDAADALQRVPEADRRSDIYWAMRVQQSAQTGSVDPISLRLYELVAARRLTPSSAAERLEPLRENNPQGSVDAWGYRRVPISWRTEPWLLPSSQAGADLWLLDPDAARAALGDPPASASCD